MQRYEGGVIILTLFAISISLIAFTGLGLAEMMWQKREVQKISDMTARQAATQLGDGPAFTTAYGIATANGAKAGEVSIQCQTGAGVSISCAQASRVFVTTTRTIRPLFFGSTRTVTAVAQAAPSPFVAGSISSGLLSLNTQQSIILNGIVNAIGGGKIALDAVSWQGLLLTDLKVNLLDLSTALNLAQASQLAGLQVNLGDLLNLAVAVADGGSKQTAEIVVNQLRVPLNAVQVNLGRILQADVANRDAARVDLRLGDIALGAILAGADGRAVSVPLSLNGLGIDLKLYVVEPPQLIVGRKKEGTPIVAYGRTGQVKIQLNSKGLSVPVGIPGIVSVRVSALNMSTYLQVGGAQATVKDIQCKIPRDNNITKVNLSTSLATLCVGAAPLRFADDSTSPIMCKGPANILKVDLVLLFIPISLEVAANAYASADSETRDIDLRGRAPLTTTANWRASNGVSGLLRSIDLNLSVDASIASLNLLEPVLSLLYPLVDTILAFVVQLLSPVLDTVGFVLDSVLSLLGLSLNQSTLRLNTLDCSSSILTQ